ncbi:hypothetical protein [Pasteuria penetrans]|uniref:hypothetical protein n=1 Tax=Pasteuria penetrans TaxID=86005 RepID=UPI000FB83AEE|nr:hypothetical protein [Pasteuria penetrans]
MLLQGDGSQSQNQQQTMGIQQQQQSDPVDTIQWPKWMEQPSDQSSTSRIQQEEEKPTDIIPLVQYKMQQMQRKMEQVQEEKRKREKNLQMNTLLPIKMATRSSQKILLHKKASILIP